jgi:hypothetical protein
MVLLITDLYKIRHGPSRSNTNTNQPDEAKLVMMRLMVVVVVLMMLRVMRNALGGGC